MNSPEPLGSIVLSPVGLFIDWCSRAIRSCMGSKAIESPTSTGAAQQIVPARASQDQCADGASESVTIDLGDDTLSIRCMKFFRRPREHPRTGHTTLKCKGFTGSLLPTLWRRCGST
jgi:hypothetical protein